MQERESDWRYFKGLRLVTAKQAIALGVPAEGPVFVSPNVEGMTRCDDCGVNYAPLVYQTRYVTEAHHVHYGSGGIYFARLYPRDNDYVSRTGASLGGWMAFVEPLWDIDDDDTRWRPRRVMVTGIKAYCFVQTANGYCAEELEVGFVVQKEGLLHPVCDLDEHKRSGQPIFQFRIRDGQVVFGNI